MYLIVMLPIKQVKYTVMYIVSLDILLTFKKSLQHYLMHKLFIIDIIIIIIILYYYEQSRVVNYYDMFLIKWE